ncbi:RNA exonuclease 4-like [Pyrus ussuriensis x Pyrus communis]|uniref:RNA exonuclease 4-like n=1 Tax=Pyrus ussuriensis x Pyrus communis TaxID=2448454 RepID=A0A5N5G536_9ROSA|nr:RNA exonuclease 4-like [Pyrus ussuriensis x Pyrus communis]
MGWSKELGLLGPFAKTRMQKYIQHQRMQNLLSHPRKPGLLGRFANLGIRDNTESGSTRDTQVVALACKMVAGGSDGSLDLCANVCLTDEYDNIIFQSYVKPLIPVTNYRYDTTGIRPEYLRDAIPLRQVRKKIKTSSAMGNQCGRFDSEVHNDYFKGYSKISSIDEIKQAQQLPQVSHTSISWASIQDPYEDCVATMKIYKRMRSQVHKVEAYPLASDTQNRNNLATWRQNELEKMRPDQMMEMSRSDYYCWCLDSYGG